ncbi:MAG: hypothetical protein AB4372_39050 [Xenococcus sp. (in: cyanobacteria)]
MGLIIGLVATTIAIVIPAFGFSTGGVVGGTLGGLVDVTLISITINFYKP